MLVEIERDYQSRILLLEERVQTNDRYYVDYTRSKCRSSVNAKIFREPRLGGYLPYKHRSKYVDTRIIQGNKYHLNCRTTGLSKRITTYILY